MTPEHIEKELAGFETHFKGWELARRESDGRRYRATGTYCDDETQAMFEAWLARAEQDQALRAAAVDLIKYWDSADWKWHTHLDKFMNKMRDLL